MTSPFNIITTVEIESKIVDKNNQLVAFPEIEVNVQGQLSGPQGRELTLTAQETSSLGYTFKEWIVEVSGVKLISVPVGGFTTTIEGMCVEGSLQTEVSNVVYTDGKFFYNDEEGSVVSNTGYYGAGSNSYYYHDTAQGILGPFACNGAALPTTTGGGGFNPSQPDDETTNITPNQS